jgi:hypothetical protein
MSIIYAEKKSRYDKTDINLNYENINQKSIAFCEGQNKTYRDGGSWIVFDACRADFIFTFGSSRRK